MNQKAKKAYSYYKNLYPIPIIMFRIGDIFHALGDDAEKVCKVLNRPSAETVSADNVFDFIRECAEHGLFVRLIEMRGSDGNFDIPDVELIDSEA